MKSTIWHSASKTNNPQYQGRQNYRAGHFAEWLALMYLRAKGYRKIAVNFVTGRGSGAGEVDLILCRNKTLVFAEVKARRSLDDAAEAILPRQQERIRRGAEAFLQQNPSFQSYDIRFDAVLIALPCHLQHLENAF